MHQVHAACLLWLLVVVLPRFSVLAPFAQDDTPTGE